MWKKKFQRYFLLLLLYVIISIFSFTVYYQRSEHLLSAGQTSDARHGEGMDDGEDGDDEIIDLQHPKKI